jgi:hypothetical protein
MGASFCQVINRILVFILTFGTISMNQLWNGAEASLIKIAAVPAMNKRLVFLMVVGVDKYMIIMAEAVD